VACQRPPSELLASPSELSASPSELLASPSELSASPSELLASPSELLASPSELTCQRYRAVVGDGVVHSHARVVATRLVPAARLVTDELGTVVFEYHLRTVIRG
jgi:hypothetical protein